MAQVAIAHSLNIEEAVAQSLALLDLKGLFSDKLVAIKPNDTWADESDKTAVTQPDTLKAVIRFIKKFHPKHIITSGGSGAGETDEIFQIAGLMQVVEQEGIEFFDHNRPPFVDVELGSGPQKSVKVNPKVLEYETLVSLSQLKVHETATVTLGMKNIAMSYPAADYYGHPRGSYKHQHNFFRDMHGFIAAMAKRFPIQLSIIAGHPAMIGTGPIGGHTFETGLIIASTDPLAADVVGARILGFNLAGARQLSLAEQLGVGEGDISKMEFPGLPLQEAMNIFSKAGYGRDISLEHP